ncbi:hypothetical protein BC941DRAFT_438934 [Chlamydoabsidia padenii]|nr:hypothetical protein BC941DRAFT_438934 [Chlamydoabsidia padenii]
MIAQDKLTPTSYTTNAPSFVSGERLNGPLGPFLKEAIQILIQASRTVSTPHYNNNNNNNNTTTSRMTDYTNTSFHDTPTDITNNAENTTDTPRRQQQKQRQDSSGDTPTVTWKLNLSPTFMTLDTNIQTVAGLVQVLGQLFANVDPQPILTNSSSSSSSLSSRTTTSSTSSTLSPTHSPPAPFTTPSPAQTCLTWTSTGSSIVSLDQYSMFGIIHAIAEALRLSQVLVVPQMDVFRQVNTIQLMKQCVQLFIMCDSGAFFMDVPDLLSKTDLVLTTANSTLFNNNNNNNNNEHALDTLLLLSICCMMIRHVMVHRRGHTAVSAGLAHAFYSHARVRLQDLFDIPHITVLRSAFLLSVFPHGFLDLFSTSRLSSPLLTSATRMMLAMNLHQLDAPNNNNNEGYDADEKERRRRLAWMILCADHFSTMNRTGQSGLIDVNLWHVDFPQPSENEQAVKRRVELFSHYCRIVMIRKLDLFQSVYRVVSQSNKALASFMDQHLFDMYTSTSDHHLHLDLDLDLDQHLARQWTKKDDLESLLLESLHCNSLIMALVPFLPRRYLATFEQGIVSREAGIRDVYQSMKHQSSASNCSITPLPPRTPFHHGYQRSNTKGGDNDDDDEEQQHLEMHTVIRCLTVANRLSYILEILGGVDSIHCHHQPTHAALVLAYVYDMIQTNCQHSKVAMICRLNLIRLLRLVQQARLVDPDLTLVYLDRTLTSYIGSTTDESSVSLERTTASLLFSLRQQQAAATLDGIIKSEPLG